LVLFYDPRHRLHSSKAKVPTFNDVKSANRAAVHPQSAKGELNCALHRDERAQLSMNEHLAFGGLIPERALSKIRATIVIGWK